MADVITQEQYDAIKEYYRIEKDYYDMSEDEQAEFDEKLDDAMAELYEVDDSEDSEQTESNDLTNENSDTEKMEVSGDEIEQIKNEVRYRNGYDNMSEEEREAFDESLDQYCDETFEITDEENERDKSDESENSHVKKLIR